MREGAAGKGVEDYFLRPAVGRAELPSYTRAPPGNAPWRFPQPMSYSTPPPIPSAVAPANAGILLRFLATVVDSILLGIVNSVLLVPFFAVVGITSAKQDSMTEEEAVGAGIALIVTYLGAMGGQFVIGWLYSAIMESSRFQGTLGKIVLGIRVTDLSGQRVGFGRATGRYFAKILSAMIFCVGFLMVAFTEKKQGLHDMIASTLVLKKS